MLKFHISLSMKISPLKPPICPSNFYINRVVYELINVQNVIPRRSCSKVFVLLWSLGSKFTVSSSAHLSTLH